MTGFKDEGGYAKYCSWDIVVQNRTDTDLDKIRVMYDLVGVRSQVIVKKLAAGSSTVIKKGIYSSKCEEMGRVKPANPIIEKCKLGTMIDSDCTPYLVIK